MSWWRKKKKPDSGEPGRKELQAEIKSLEDMVCRLKENNKREGKRNWQTESYISQNHMEEKDSLKRRHAKEKSELVAKYELESERLEKVMLVQQRAFHTLERSFEILIETHEREGK